MLFKKAICFTDIHYGLKSNNLDHNKDCDQFIDWVIETAKKHNIKTCIFMGDWHHNRQNLNIETLHYSIKGLEKLNNNFDIVYFIVGNHDLYYKESREISSIKIANSLDNIFIIDEPYHKDDVSFYPWLVGDEWKEVKKIKSKYIFGHFELPNFYLNQMIKMPDTGELSAKHFNKDSYVFSGHFHKRQFDKNVGYIGNAFPHDYNDLNDDERGVMILEWDKAPNFISWPNAPVFRKYNYNDLKDNEDKLFKNCCKINLKIEYNPDDISSTQISNYRDELQNKYDIRGTIKLMEIKPEDNHEGNDVSEEIVDENIDGIVVEQIESIDTEDYDISLLIEIYRNLD